jgi:hypothetical protein
VKSNSEAIRLIQQGGVTVDGARVDRRIHRLPRPRRPATCSRWASAASRACASSRSAGRLRPPASRRRGERGSAHRGTGARVPRRRGDPLSRIVGLIRQRVFAHYFGISAAGDAFSQAFRIPNFLQNIFGEGALSGSYIPVYSRLLAKGRRRRPARVANTVFSLLALATSTIVLVPACSRLPTSST